MSSNIDDDQQIQSLEFYTSENTFTFGTLNLVDEIHTWLECSYYWFYQLLEHDYILAISSFRFWCVVPTNHESYQSTSNAELKR